MARLSSVIPVLKNTALKSPAHWIATKEKSEIIDAGTVPENFIGQIIKKAPQNVIIIDAVNFGSPTGTIKLFNPQQDESFTVSTHSASLKLFCDCISSEINCRFFLAGIQPAQTDFNSSLSNEVQAAVGKIADRLAKIFC